MREITSHIVSPADEQIKITVLDDDRPSGTNHVYQVNLGEGFLAQQVQIRFQNGATTEHGVNGITQEALLAIIIDRLQLFQKGPLACRENALALTKLEEAKHWLFSRTMDRMERGVHGTSAQ